MAAAQPEAGQAPSQPVNAKAVAALIEQLGSTDFVQRQAATRRLEQIGRPALAALREAAEKHADLEVRRRVKALLEKLENSLEQLLEDYRAYELPLPPKDAPLVRFVYGIAYGEDEKEIPHYNFGFLFKPAGKGTDAVVLDGPRLRRPWSNYEVIVVDMRKISVDEIAKSSNSLILAIQCKARGWDSLAKQLFEKVQKAAATTPRAEVRQDAWKYCESELSRSQSDWSLAARHLHPLIESDPKLDTKWHRALLQSLDAALVPSKAPAVSIDALIDGLINAGPEYGWVFDEELGDPSYRRLVEKGFEAVPALIKHLDDDRLTRYRPKGHWSADAETRERHAQQYRVHDIVRDLLNGLAGENHQLQFFEPGQQSRAAAWWTDARQVGEEEYLVKHVLPTSEDDRPSDEMLWLLVKKYPRRLPKIYRTLLDERPDIYSDRVVSALTRSNVSRAEKVELLVYAGRHRNLSQRLVALAALQGFDQERYVQLLVDTLDGLPKTIQGTYGNAREPEFAGLVARTADARAWQALHRAARRADVGLRMELLRSITLFEWTPEFKLAENRRARLNFLASLLEDGSVRDLKADPKRYAGRPAGHLFPRLEVRNFATIELSRQLGMQSKPSPDWNDAQWARFRREVREALKREAQVR
jgi:hypothetical protein